MNAYDLSIFTEYADKLDQRLKEDETAKNWSITDLLNADPTILQAYISGDIKSYIDIISKAYTNKNMQKRVQYAKSLPKQIKFNGKIFILGCGSVCRATLPLLFQLVDFQPRQLVIMDMLDCRPFIKLYLNQGITFVHKKLNQENYSTVLLKEIKLAPGDIFIDFSWDVDTLDMLKICNENGILYVNTSVEDWDPYGEEQQTTTDYTLYFRHQEIRNAITSRGPTAIIDHGANPGFVQHLVKRALVDIATKYNKKLLKYAQSGQFNVLAQMLGLKTIHISERDTQISTRPKKTDEFVNTWSIPGFQEEGLAPVELGWGTHETKLPRNAVVHKVGNKNQICLHTRGINTMMKSFIKSGPIEGYLIRHGEAYSLSDRLTVFAKNTLASYLHNPNRFKDNPSKVLYRPSVYYVYCPCDYAIASIHEFKMLSRPQKENRIMYDDIIEGKDELGVTLYGDFGCWWIGSLLDINETRQIIDPTENCINSTSLQVGSSAISAIIYAMRHPNIGICFPDDINYEEVLKTTEPFLGPMYSGPLDVDKKYSAGLYQDFVADNLI